MFLAVLLVVSFFLIWPSFGTCAVVISAAQASHAPPQNRCALAGFDSLFLGASLIGVRQTKLAHSQFFTNTRIGLVALLIVSTMDLQVRRCPAGLAFPAISLQDFTTS